MLTISDWGQFQRSILIKIWKVMKGTPGIDYIRKHFVVQQKRTSNKSSSDHFLLTLQLRSVLGIHPIFMFDAIIFVISRICFILRDHPILVAFISQNW